MPLFESYLFLVKDSFYANLAFNISSELAIWSMHTFGGYNSILLICIATTGSTIANICNYLAGKAIYRLIYYVYKNAPSQYRITKSFFDRYLVLMLIFSYIVAVGKFCVLFTGMLRCNFYIVILTGVAIKALYYTYYLF